MSDSLLFSPIARDPLAESVASRLREAIITARLAPGQRLSEVELAGQMRVSRGPVREALAQLEREGLVVGQSNRRSYVWEPNTSDVDEIISLRISVECLAAEWAITKLNDEDFAKLEDLLGETQDAAARHAYWQHIESDAEFHGYMCRRSEHARLYSWWQEIRRQWEVLAYRHLCYSPEAYFSLVVSDHHSIVAALRSRNLDEVVSIHHANNKRFCEIVKGTLLATSNGSEGSRSNNGRRASPAAK